MDIFKSRKFWTAIVDVAVVLILYFVGKYAAPGLAEDVNFIVAAMQPVFVMVIAGFAIEDAAAKKAGNFPPWQ